MSETFDSYRKWLGIPPAEQPPDHYRLLGIGRFEDDLDTISNAADRQMAHVRTYQAGPHSAESQKLLNEIAAARVCLLNAAKKAEYDRLLRAKEIQQARPTAAAHTRSDALPRPIPVAPPSARPMPPYTAASSPTPVRAASEVTVDVRHAPRQTQPAAEVPIPAAEDPIEVAPAARRRQPKIASSKTEREPSEAHKTLFIAAGVAAIALALFVVYKTRSGAGGKVSREQAKAAIELINDDAEKTRAISESSEQAQDHVVLTGKVIANPEITVTTDDDSADAPVASKPEADPADSTSVWLELTRKLNDINFWKAASGDWSERDGRFHGQGDARLNFQEELPEAFLLSFEMTVVEGMRPRIVFGDRNFHFGNEGYSRTLFVHDGISLPIVGAPRPYETGIPLQITCRITEQEIEFQVDGKLVAQCGRKRSGPLPLILSAGDSWSKGQVLFGPFTLGPASAETSAPRGSASDSVDLLALVDVPRDQVNGDWKREGAALVAPQQADARLQLPYSPGIDYELTVVAERLAGTDSFINGLVIGGHQVAMTLDGYGGDTAGLADLDKHDGATNETTRRGKRLPPGQPHTVVCTVHEGSVRVMCDGQEALNWSGDAARLSNAVFWEVPDKRRLYLGAWESKFKYTRVEVRPLTRGEKLTSPSPSITNKDAPWRDLFDGKSLVGWTGDVAAMKVENSVLVSRGKRAIVVAPGEYHDFELEIEFRLARDGNSGLGVWYSGSGDPSQSGLEIQMLDDTTNRRLQDIQRCGAVYGLAAAKAGHFKRWPAWNRLRVTAVENNVEVDLNGTLVTDTTRSLMKQRNPQHAGVSRTSGKVCLFPTQGRSEYRQIRIREAK